MVAEIREQTDSCPVVVVFHPLRHVLFSLFLRLLAIYSAFMF
jgi:hypothetical protein